MASGRGSKVSSCVADARFRCGTIPRRHDATRGTTRSHTNTVAMRSSRRGDEGSSRRGREGPTSDASLGTRLAWYASEAFGEVANAFGGGSGGDDDGLEQAASTSSPAVPSQLPTHASTRAHGCCSYDGLQVTEATSK